MGWHKTDGLKPKSRDRKRAAPQDVTGQPIAKPPPGPGPHALRSISEGLYSPAAYKALSIASNQIAYHKRADEPDDAEQEDAE